MTLMDFPTQIRGAEELLTNEHNKLEFIFEAQRKLMHRYHEIEEENGCHIVSPLMEGMVDDRVVQMRLKDLAQRLIEELCEATSELKNRPWKQSETPTDVEAFREEVVDVMHYFVEFCITAGITPEDLHRGFMRKHNKNVQRQASGY